jgi:hypothetical protein
MTLPASQQHALDAIDEVLQSAEPRLASMFGVFTDLTRLEAMPATETMTPSRWTRYRVPGRRYHPGRPHRPRGRQAGRRVGRMVLVPLLLIAAVSLLVVSLVNAGPTGRRGCAQAVVAVMGARVRPAVSDTAGTDSLGDTGIGGAGCRTASAQPASR